MISAWWQVPLPTELLFCWPHGHSFEGVYNTVAQRAITSALGMPSFYAGRHKLFINGMNQTPDCKSKMFSLFYLIHSLLDTILSSDSDIKYLTFCMCWDLWYINSILWAVGLNVGPWKSLSVVKGQPVNTYTREVSKYLLGRLIICFRYNHFWWMTAVFIILRDLELLCC